MDTASKTDFNIKFNFNTDFDFDFVAHNYT